MLESGVLATDDLDTNIWVTCWTIENVVPGGDGLGLGLLVWKGWIDDDWPVYIACDVDSSGWLAGIGCFGIERKGIWDLVTFLRWFMRSLRNVGHEISLKWVRTLFAVLYEVYSYELSRTISLAQLFHPIYSCVLFVRFIGYCNNICFIFPSDKLYS